MRKNKYIFFIIYKLFFCFILSSCKFYPTCSVYFCDKFFKYNFFFALFICLKRIVKCNLFNNGGFYL